MERMKGSSPNHLPLTTYHWFSAWDFWVHHLRTIEVTKGPKGYRVHSNWYPQLFRPQVFKVKLHTWIIYIYMWIQILFSSTPSRCQWLPCINCGQIAIFVSQRPPWNEARLSSCLLHHRPHWRQDPCAGWRAKNLRNFGIMEVINLGKL